MTPEIFYLQTYDVECNIGRAYNNHIKHLPNDSWIVISDHDSNFLIPDFGIQLVDVIKKYGNEFDLLGCVTNRLRGKHQLYKNEFSENFDIKHHFGIACDLFKNEYAEIEETDGIAGVFMMFKKSTWEKVGGFVENSIICDTLFNKAVKNAGGKIGIIKGLYLFHCYRLWAKDYRSAINEVGHLQNKK